MGEIFHYWIILWEPSWIFFFCILKSLIISIIGFKSDKCTNRLREFFECIRIIFSLNKIIDFLVDFIQFVPFAICNCWTSFLQQFYGLMIVKSKLDVFDCDLFSFWNHYTTGWHSLLLFFIFLVLIFWLIFFIVFCSMF